MRAAVVGLVLVGLMAANTPAQEPPVAATGEPAPSDRAVTLTYANRRIVELRAQVIGRLPDDRAAAAVRTLDDLVSRGVTSPVTTRAIAGAVFVVVGGEGVFAILPDDVDVLAGETVQGAANAAAARLHVALDEKAELRAPVRLLRAVAETVAITAVLAVVFWLLWRLQRAAARRLTRIMAPRPGAHSLSVLSTHLERLLRSGVTLSLGAAALVVAYLWLAFVLRRFPYTRPWGESLRAILVNQLTSLGGTIVDATPGLFAVLLILIAVRWASRAISRVFDAVEAGRLSLPGVYPDTAAPTRRLVTAALWLAALALAYPYVPGSESDGVKGIGVFVGLVLSLGSTGVVQHLMSGLMLTYARAVHVGDFARIGEYEGTILQVGAIATKIRTPIGEEVTIPNAVVVSQTVTNYSAGSDAASYLPTSVTIGYDTPWRQVEFLLLTAARRTPGIRATPPPAVRRVALEDYYVKYTLLVAPEDPCRRAVVLDGLLARVLDAFNEEGVRIMSPHYVADPAAPKVVPPSRGILGLVSPSQHAVSRPAPLDAGPGIAVESPEDPPERQGS